MYYYLTLLTYRFSINKYIVTKFKINFYDSKTKTGTCFKDSRWGCYSSFATDCLRNHNCKPMGKKQLLIKAPAINFVGAFF